MFRSIHAKKLIAGVALASAAGLVLAGCSAANPGSSDGVTEITFSSWLPTQDQWPEIIAAFEAENPDINVTFTRDEDYAAYTTNLNNDILADDIPDLYGIQVGASFDDYSEFALDTADYAADWIGDLNGAAVDQTTNSDGIVAAVPILMGGMQYFLYNKTILDQLGLALPTNYDELVSVSQVARDAGYSAFAMGAADTWHDADFYVWLSNQFGDGGDVYRAAAGDIPWDSQSLVAAAQKWQDLFTDGVFQDAATTVATYPNARDDYFLAGRSIAFPTGSWHVGAALSNSPEVPGSAVENDEIGFALFPTIGDQDAGVTSGVDFALAVSAQSSPEKQAAAAKFAEFLAVGEGQQLWVNTFQGFPAANNISIVLPEGETELAQASVTLTTESLQASTYSRKLVAPGRDSLESDLGIVLQNIADGADPATELATLNQ